MPLFSAFTPFGMLTYSSGPSHAQVIYESMRDALGPDYAQDFNSSVQARLYAQAMGLANAKYTLERARNNANPLKATEMIAELERQHGVIPGPYDTLPQRRSALDARMRVNRGARRESVEDALRSLLGSDFVAYETDTTAAPAPTSPETKGHFVEPRSRKLFRTTAGISITGSPITVGLEALLATEAFQKGETIQVDPRAIGSPEKVTVTSATMTSLTATFTKAHDVGTVITNGSVPLWHSGRRYVRIVVKYAAAIDPVKRKAVNDLMLRLARGVTQWCIVSDAGTFNLNHATRAKLDATKLV